MSRKLPYGKSESLLNDEYFLEQCKFLKGKVKDAKYQEKKEIETHCIIPVQMRKVHRSKENMPDYYLQWNLEMSTRLTMCYLKF